MLKSLTHCLFCLLMTCSLAAQCDLMAEVGEITCDTITGVSTARIIVTGSGSTVRLPALGLELPLPIDETIVIPENLDSVVFEFESGTAPDLCQARLLVIAPADCFPQPSNCSVTIEGEELNCGVPTRLTAIPTGVPPFSFRWNTGDTTSTIDYTLIHFDYAVTVTDADGCEISTSRFFNEVSPFNVHVESSGTVCSNGEAPQLTATVFHGNGPFTYEWSTGDTTQTITDVLPEQFYVVTVTDAAGCSSTAQGLYHPGAFGQRLTISGPTSTNCDDTPIVLRVDDPDPNFTYTWTTGIDTLIGDSITITGGGHFTVVGTQEDNPSCRVFGSYQVSDINYDTEDLSIVSFIDSCDNSICVLVMDGNGNMLLGNDLVVWSSPNTDNIDQGFGFACFTEPGLYQATITTPCDTITLFTSIKSFPPCTDLCGMVMMDLDEDCNPDPGGQDWSNLGILITNDSTNVSYRLIPEPDGSFCVVIPEGSYSVRSMDDGMTLSTNCDFEEATMSVFANTPIEMDLFARLATDEEEGGDATTSVLNADVASELKLRVFPNPSFGSLRFDLGDARISPKDVLTIYDNQGRLKDRIAVEALPNTWRPRGINRGFFQLILTDQDGRFKARTGVIFQ